MAVKLHGIRGGAARPRGPWVQEDPGRAPATPQASQNQQVSAPRTPPRDLRPLPGKPPGPRQVRPPLTTGRILYFAVLLGLLLGGTYWLWLYLMYARAVGVIERDVDRLAPREQGRILRVDVQPGDTVRKGQVLVWFDYAAGARGEGPGYISDQEARAGAERQRLMELRRRRHEVEERRALLRADMAALRTRAQGLRMQQEAVARAHGVAERLERAGAATVAEVLRLQQQLAAVEQDHAVAMADARQKEHAERALDEEAQQLDRAIAAATAAPAPAADPGLLTAPRDGVVAWVAHHPGEVVGPGDAVVLLRGGPLRVRAYVLPKDAHSLAAGRSVRVELPTGEVLDGQVARQHLLAKNLAEGKGPVRDPALAEEPLTPFLLADVELRNIPAELAERLPVGAPCEVWARKSWRRILRSSLEGRL